jgi:hypothetical protein
MINADCRVYGAEGWAAKSGRDVPSGAQHGGFLGDRAGGVHPLQLPPTCRAIMARHGARRAPTDVRATGRLTAE